MAMLFYPKWDKSREVTLENFLAFVEAQDTKQEYKWTSCMECAVALWLIAIDHPRRNYPDVWEEPVVFDANMIACYSTPTFGALAGRLRRYIDRSNISRSYSQGQKMRRLPSLVGE
jgi:hypothetical protein